MTLAEAFLKRTGCNDIKELKNVSPEMRKILAVSVDKLDSKRVPLNDWNTLILAYGGEPAASQEDAKARLILRLLINIQPAEKTAPVPAVKDTSEENAKETPAEPKKKPVSLIRKIWNWITTAIVAVAVILAVLLVGVRLAGLQVFSVLSGSMEPVYHVGALIYVKTVDHEDLKIGDDITFMLNEDTVATHRIIEILPDEEDPEVLRFRTQGVANNSPDGTPVHCKNVVGKPVFTIPYLGYVSDYIQNPPGTYVTLSAAAIFLILVFIPDLFSSDEPQDEKKKKPAEAKKPRG